MASANYEEVNVQKHPSGYWREVAIFGVKVIGALFLIALVLSLLTESGR